MYTLIRYCGGVIVEGVVLARGQNHLRVAVPGFPEVVELNRTGALWSADSGESVEFDFFMKDRKEVEAPSRSKCVGAAGAS
jgi:hypothetical protein